MLTEAEDDLVARIKAAPVMQKLRQVGTLPDLDGDTLVKDFFTNAPAAYVSPAAVLTIKDRVINVGFSVACVAKNAAGHEAARKGDGKMIGMYLIAENIAALLDGFVAGDIPLYCTGISLLNDEKLFKAGLQVAVVTLAGQALLDSGIDVDALDDFETLSSQYDLPQHESDSEHTKWQQEPPNHSTSKPEIIDTLTLNN